MLEKRRQDTRSYWWFATGPRGDFRGSEWLSPIAQYACGQAEVGDGENSYEHYHVVVRFQKRTSFEQAKELFGPTFHLEKVRNTKATIAYCTKETGRIPGTGFLVGDKPLRRNEQTDWDRIYRSAAEGRMDEIPFDIRIRCAFQLEFIRRTNYTPRPFWHPRKTVWCFWGPTGTGKTRKALSILQFFDFYEKNSRTKWWDGYRQQPAVLIDEFNGAIHWDYMKMWCDGYVNRPCEIKQSTTFLSAKLIIITSQKPVEEWWPDIPQVDLEAVKRRINFRKFVIRQL